MFWFSACLVFLSEIAKFLKAMPSSESSHETTRKLRREQTVAEKIHDEVRTIYLTSRGYRVLRFWNDQVLANADQVLADIEKFLGAHSSES
jgi:very-short-patch-repair endonuclease